MRLSFIAARSSKVALVVLAFLLTPVAQAQAAAGPTAIERPALGYGGKSHHADNVKLPSRPISGKGVISSTAKSVTANPGPAPFMTRPYWGWHSLNSWFDHCNPDYSIDGKLCTVDGTVALKSNGYDPSFNKGYAATPGGSDYLYYDGHNGYDLGLWYEELLAAAPGVVTVAGTDPVPYNACYGNTVVIDHGNGISTRYAHMSQVDVSVGQTVYRGEHIGISGNSGCTTGPHLHFGVYTTSPWTAIDAWGWLGAAGADPWPYDQGDLWLTGNPMDPVPDAPTNVVATPAVNSIMVTWSAPGWDGGGLSGYTVTASPGGATVTTDATHTSAVFNNLMPTTAYTFTVAGFTQAGQGVASTASLPVNPKPSYTVPPADLVSVNYDPSSNSGNTWVMKSSGSWFDNAPSEWSSLPFSGNRAMFAADVSGDGKADLVAVNYDSLQGAGSTWVMTSTGSQFNPPALWSSTPFSGNVTLLAADLTGSGKSDLIAVNYHPQSGTGDIWVMLANATGTGFGAPQLWSTVPFAGAVTTLAADVDGDKKADLIAVNAGDTWVMTSNGVNAFNPPKQWSAVNFSGTKTVLAGDFSGDGKADLVAVNDQSTWVMTSTGTSFKPPVEWSTGAFYGGTSTLAGDASGDGKADLIAVDYSQTRVLTSTGAAFAAGSQWSTTPFSGTRAVLAANLTG